jgi:hypothetical protein
MKTEMKYPKYPLMEKGVSNVPPSNSMENAVFHVLARLQMEC